MIFFKAKTPTKHTYFVASLSKKKNTWYETSICNPPECSCNDHEKNPKREVYYLCKHHEYVLRKIYNQNHRSVFFSKDVISDSDIYRLFYSGGSSSSNPPPSSTTIHPPPIRPPTPTTPNGTPFFDLTKA